MEQKQTQKSKRQLYSVYVFVRREIQEGRSMARRKRLNQTRPDRYLPGEETVAIKKFLYVDVIKMFKKENVLCIQVGVGKKKEIHKHELKSISSIQIREHDRSGRIQ